MAIKILKVIRIGKNAYGPGDEKALLTAVNPALLQSLHGRNLISKSPTKSAQTAESTPIGPEIPIKDLGKFLDGVNDPEVIQQWADEDVRLNATPQYINALDRIANADAVLKQRGEEVKEKLASRKPASKPRKKASSKLRTEEQDGSIVDLAPDLRKKPRKKKSKSSE